MSEPVDRTPSGLVHRYVDACNERRMDDFDLIFPPDFTSHLRIGDIHGLAPFKDMVRDLFMAFPDILWTLIEEIYAPGRAVIRYTFEGTHVGPFLGVAASHRRVRVAACEVMVIEDGWVPEIWNYADLMGMAAQMNAEAPLALRL